MNNNYILTKRANRNKEKAILLLLTAFCSLFPAFLFAQMEWTCATDSAGWSGRWGLQSVILNNKIWILGGNDGNLRNDVWFSSDGVNWICATNSAGWSPRHCASSVIFDNKLWVIGGYDNISKNDVWYSADGVNWTCANDSAEWSAREWHSSVVFENKMWVLGRRRGYLYNYHDDVWYSRGLGIEEDRNPLSLELSLLKEIHPNPFKTDTRITYTLTKPSTVKLAIHNSAGQEVSLLVNSRQETGSHNIHWNGRDDSGKTLPASIYFIQLESERYKETRKIVKFQ
jgi:hypothetical protein